MRARGEGEPIIVERFGRAQLNGRAERAFIRFGFLGLGDLHAGKEVCGEDVEVELAVAVGAAVAATGCGEGFHAVDLDADEIGRKAAHVDRAAFAAVAVDLHAGDALERFSKVEVREVADVFGADRIHDTGLVALDRNGLLQALAEAGDDDRLLTALIFGRNVCFLSRCATCDQAYGSGAHEQTEIETGILETHFALLPGLSVCHPAAAYKGSRSLCHR